MNNRKGNIPVPNPYDIIIGPIAADIIYDAFGIPTSGFISDEEALKIMSYGQEYQQLVICSEKARAQLTWLDAKKIDEKQLIENREIIERETLSFQAELANILEGTDDSKL